MFCAGVPKYRGVKGIKLGNPPPFHADLWSCVTTVWEKYKTPQAWEMPTPETPIQSSFHHPSPHQLTASGQPTPPLGKEKENTLEPSLHQAPPSSKRRACALVRVFVARCAASLASTDCRRPRAWSSAKRNHDDPTQCPPPSKELPFPPPWPRTPSFSSPFLVPVPTTAAGQGMFHVSRDIRMRRTAKQPDLVGGPRALW